MNAARKPRFTWVEYQAACPGTRHSNITYCAGDFNFREAGKDASVGYVFTWDGSEWRVVLLCGNPFAPVKAVPACWPEKYWE